MKRTFLRIIAAILLVSSMIGVCSSCTLLDSILGKDKGEGDGDGKTPPKADLVIFENGKYNCNFVYPTFSDATVSELRNELRAAFKKKTGINPTFDGDEKNEANAEVFEVLLGSTNRPESATPEGVGETDSYYTVSVIGNKIVINGSDTYQLGVAIEYFVQTYLSGDVAEKVTVPGDFSEQKILKDFTRENWKLNGIPAYSQAGTNKLIAAVYKSGTTITGMTSSNRDKSDVNLQRIENTTDAEFAAYLAKLESFGFEKEYENIADETSFLTYTKGDVRFHVSYKPGVREVQVIDDPNGITVEEFGYSYTPAAGERSEYYLYGIPMASGISNGTSYDAPNCGTLSIIKCADNSVIIIDGGEYEGDGGLKQMYSAEVMQALDEFLHQITGTPSGEKVRISCWYLSHYHSDHTRGFLEFLKKYKANYELERVLANVPTLSCGGSSNPFGTSMTSWVYQILDQWSDLIKVNYPNCKEIKVHAGQKIQIADVSLDILYTHEDLLNANNRFSSGDSNDTSIVTRFDNGQMSMISLGDANASVESKLRRIYTTVSLKSDIVQPAHHLINDVFAIYKEIQPTYALAPQTYFKAPKAYFHSKLYDLVDVKNCYFAGNETVGLGVENGKIKVIYHDLQAPYTKN